MGGILPPYRKFFDRSKLPTEANVYATENLSAKFLFLSRLAVAFSLVAHFGNLPLPPYRGYVENVWFVRVSEFVSASVQKQR